MSSAAESELGALFITAKLMIPLQQTLAEIGWPQPPSPVQTDNSTTEGVVNNTIVPRKLNLWIYDFAGYAAKKRHVNSAITGPSSIQMGRLYYQTL